MDEMDMDPNMKEEGKNDDDEIITITEFSDIDKALLRTLYMLYGPPIRVYWMDETSRCICRTNMPCI